MPSSREKVKNKNSLPATPRKNTGKNNRLRGHNYERKIAKEHRDLGFARCLTTRQASRLWDDCKLDLYGIPVNTQLKNVNGTIKYEQVLEDMKEKVEENLPERKDLPFVVFHKKGRVELVVMSKDDYYKLLIKDNG